MMSLKPLVTLFLSENKHAKEKRINYERKVDSFVPSLRTFHWEQQQPVSCWKRRLLVLLRITEKINTGCACNTLEQGALIVKPVELPYMFLNCGKKPEKLGRSYYTSMNIINTEAQRRHRKSGTRD